MSLEKKCVSCEKSLDFRKWGPERICPFCGKDTVIVDIKEVHVSFGDGHSQSFTHFIIDKAMDSALRRNGKEFHVGIDYYYVRLEYELCFGNISNPPYSNAVYYAHHYSSAKSRQLGIEYQLEKISGIEKSVPIYLWLSNDEPNELMNLLYFAKTFERFEQVFLVRWEHTEEDFEGALQTMILALKKKVRLFSKDISDLSARFSEIQGWNSECLIGNSETVEPWPLSKLEEYVLAAHTDRYREIGAIYSDTLDAIERDTSYHIRFKMVEEAVHRLMMMGKVRSHGACMWWGESHYNNMICTQEFRLSSPSPRTYTKSDIIKVVCDAFEFGYTYPLYDLLNQESVLVTEEQDVSGRWSIIEYIEDDGSYRVNCCDQKIECHITKVETGADYHKGDIYILLQYEKDDLTESWLVKVLTRGNIIHKIEISKPKGGLELSVVEK